MRGKLVSRTGLQTQLDPDQVLQRGASSPMTKRSALLGVARVQQRKRRLEDVRAALETEDFGVQGEAERRTIVRCGIATPQWIQRSHLPFTYSLSHNPRSQDFPNLLGRDVRPVNGPSRRPLNMDGSQGPGRLRMPS